MSSALYAKGEAAGGHHEILMGECRPVDGGKAVHKIAGLPEQRLVDGPLSYNAADRCTSLQVTAARGWML